MLSLLPAALAASLLFPFPHPAEPDAHGAIQALPSDPATTVLAIMRPDASDLFVPDRTRTTAVAILTRNPTLIRPAGSESPYRLSRATDLAWQTFRGSNLPGARVCNALQPLSVPEPGPAWLLTFSSLLLLRRQRRPPSFELRTFALRRENRHPE